MSLKDLLSVNAGATGYDLLIRFHSRLPREQLLQALDCCGLESDSLRKCYVDASENQRLEIIMPLIKTPGSAGNFVERLFALKRQLTLHIVHDFSPEIVTSSEELPFAQPSAAHAVTCEAAHTSP